MPEKNKKLDERISELSKTEVFKLRDNPMNFFKRLAYKIFGWYVDSIGEALWETNQRLSVILDELNMNIRVLNDTNSVLMLENTSLKEKIDLLEHECEELGKKTEECEGRYAENDDRNEYVIERLDYCDKRFDENNRRFDSVNTRFDELFTRCDSHDKRLDENNRRFDVSDKRFDELFTHCDVTNKRLDEHNARFDSADVRLDELYERSDTANKRFDEHNARFDGVDSRLDELYERSDTANKRFDEHNARFDSADSRLDELYWRGDAINKRIDESNRRFDGTDTRLDELFGRFDTVDNRFDELFTRCDIQDKRLDELSGCLFPKDKEDILASDAGSPFQKKLVIWNKDEHWLKALEVAKSLSPEHKQILVPNEFVGLQDNFYPVEQARQLELKSITGFAIRKDQVSLLDKHMLLEAWLSRFKPVWIDDVFAVFSALEETCRYDWDKEQLFSFENMIESCVNNLRETRLPYFFDSAQNRLLQEIFPHKKYLIEQFRDMSAAPLAVKQAIVKYCVSLVSIEISSYCNRKCEYCPLSFLDWRRDPNNLMNKEMFMDIVDSLAEIDYDGQISLSLFNEPLYDREYVLWALKCVNKELPNARVKITSNGDYLTADYLDALCQTGLNELWISVHYNGAWDRDVQLDRIRDILERVGIGLQGQLDDSVDRRLVFIVDPSAYHSEHMSVFGLCTEDFSIHGQDRGGILNEKVAITDNLDYCDFIYTQIDVRYNGRVVPCCQLGSGADGLEKWEYGSVNDEGGIFSAYCSKAAADFRKSLFAPREMTTGIPEPCRNCSVASSDNPALFTKDRELRRQAEAFLFKK